MSEVHFDIGDSKLSPEQTLKVVAMQAATAIMNTYLDKHASFFGDNGIDYVEIKKFLKEVQEGLLAK